MEIINLLPVITGSGHQLEHISLLQDNWHDKVRSMEAESSEREDIFTIMFSLHLSLQYKVPAFTSHSFLQLSAFCFRVV